MTFRAVKHPLFWVCDDGCRSGCGGDLASHSHCTLTAEQVTENKYWYVVNLLTPRAYRRSGHATPHMPVETAKCWRLLKVEPNAWAGGKGSCAVCVDLQAVGALEFFGEFYSLAKGFGPF